MQQQSAVVQVAAERPRKLLPEVSLRFTSATSPFTPRRYSKSPTRYCRCLPPPVFQISPPGISTLPPPVSQLSPPAGVPDLPPVFLVSPSRRYPRYERLALQRAIEDGEDLGNTNIILVRLSTLDPHPVHT